MILPTDIPTRDEIDRLLEYRGATCVSIYLSDRSGIERRRRTDRSQDTRGAGVSEGQKVRMDQYARGVDRALRPFLSGLAVPLILAAADPIDSIYRSVNTYAHLLVRGISGNPEAVSDAELAAAARTVLDDLYAAQLHDVRALYGERLAEGRALSDVAEVAQASSSVRSTRSWSTSRLPSPARSTIRPVRWRSRDPPPAMSTTSPMKSRGAPG